MNSFQLIIFFLLLISIVSYSNQLNHHQLPPPSSQKLFGGTNDSATEPEGTRWAILVAGSKYYYNYRHQADVSHAYHILKKGGLKDDNIVVFMYDDVAFSLGNPRSGTLINKPTGDDVYSGVPKDYSGGNCTADNFYVVLLGTDRLK